MLTFLATVVLDVDYGLLLGFVFSLLAIVLRTQSPHCALLGRIAHTDIYKDVLVYRDAVRSFQCSAHSFNSHRYTRTSFVEGFVLFGITRSTNY